MEAIENYSDKGVINYLDNIHGNELAIYNQLSDQDIMQVNPIEDCRTSIKRKRCERLFLAKR